MPSSADYRPLLQDEHDAEIESNIEDGGLPPPVTAGSSTTHSRHRAFGKKRRVRPGSIDLGKLDSAFKKWTENIAQKMKVLGKKKKPNQIVKKEILKGVFGPPVVYPPTLISQKTLDHQKPMSEEQYTALVQGVKAAIANDHHPRMISKGSSGSYFARAKVDARYQTISVFKPKDEEPYGRLNPKTTKWLHRKLRWIIPFGRACLIPNLSYISEAAASLLDSRLGLNIVPKTELVSLSSPAFFYDWIDRAAAKKGKPLPEKIGSMQCFMHGFQDASEFLRQHPLPNRSIADTYDDSTHRSVNASKRFLGAVKIICGRMGDDANDNGYDLDEDENEQDMFDESTESRQTFHWTPLLLQQFTEELEKLVILDYLMRNTDRGSDNYMIKTCESIHEKPLVDVAPSPVHQPQMTFASEPNSPRYPSMPTSSYFASTSALPPGFQYTKHAHVHIAAIDNSLSFPHEHPKGWRTYTYGWLYLPVSVIGRPFSTQIRKHILPLLTSKEWWEETTLQLRKLFALDPGFHPDMFKRQLAVVKGQAWNIVQCLKHSDEGPLELARRTKMLVWDDELEVGEETTLDVLNGPSIPSPLSRDSAVPPLSPKQRSKRRRHSTGRSADFPPPMRRASTDVTGIPRPVSFATKFPRINPGVAGVAVLDHMTKLDAVEAGLQRLGEDSRIAEEEEADLGAITNNDHDAVAPIPNSEIMEPSPGIEGVGPEEEDIAVPSPDLARSLPQLDPLLTLGRWSSEQQLNEQRPSERRSAEWWREDFSANKRTVIVERLEPVRENALLSCW